MAKRKTVEKPHANGTWSEARKFSFIRSNIRLMSRKWPPIREALLRARRPYKGKNKLQKWEFQCSICKNWFLQRLVHVEHAVPCGSLKCYQDIGPFVERMLVEVDGLSVQCKVCHQIKTNKEREERNAASD